MASAFVASAAAGAGLELVFGGFLKAVLDLGKNNSIFAPTLKQLEETLNSMYPSINKLDVFNRDFDRPKEIEGLKRLMEEGEQLVLKCSKIHKCNFIKKPFYTKKLIELDESLRRYISTELPVILSVDMKETLFEVKQINNQVKQINLGLRNGGLFNKSGFAGVCSPPGLKVDPVGLEIPLKDLKRKLLQEETPLIVVSAPGGCGKTTLVTAFCQDLEVKGKFRDNIFFVTVSKLPNLFVIIQRLFQHWGYDVPAFQSEEDAANQLEHLFNYIGPNPILLVLDDIWSGSEPLLEKLKFPIKDYKILVTSRFEFPRFGSAYKLQTLNDADAMTLFRHSALLPVGDLYSPDQDEIYQILRGCKGFPLAISVVGKSLCGKPAAEWRKRAKECSKAASILSNFELLTCLQSSVDALNDKIMVKECFMDLGSFPEDHKISAMALFDIWVELHKLDEDDAVAYMYELSSRNLVDLVVVRKDASQEDASYNGHYVMQHDLLRELAILQSKSGEVECRKRLFVDIFRNKFPEWWMEQKQLSINAKLLSISTDEMFSSNWCNMQTPEVEVLVLNFQTKDYDLPEFMERLDKLKVLILANYGFFPAEPSNFQLLGCLSNLKRIRLEKISIPSFFFTSIQLEKLEKMSLVMCDVDQAFSNSSIQISSAVPKLVEMEIEYCNDLVELPSGLCDLGLLRKLSITNCHKLSALPERMGNLVNLEVLRLNSCIELSRFPETIDRLQKLRILDLSDCLSIRELPEQIGELHSLKKLYMIECSNCQLPDSVLNLVHLREVICDEETATSWERYKPQLQELMIKVHKDINLNWLD